MLCMSQMRRAASLLWPGRRRHSGGATSRPWQQPTGIDSGVMIFNSLTRQKEKLIIPEGRPFTWYMCGPTVYSDAHLGHASCYVKFDIVRRILADYFHVQVFQTMGVTNIDDKIIERAKKEQCAASEVADRYERDFFRDLNRLGVVSPHLITRVTEFIPEIVQFVERLIDKGVAYQTRCGSVYFDTIRFGDRYLKLEPARRKLMAEPDPYGEKRDQKDFALWKAAKNSDEPAWASPRGAAPGRPGWHIECSAMCSDVFGASLDLHAGGEDLAFPHHDNEIAQCEALHDSSQWCSYFIHSGHLHVQSIKMSKSLDNSVLIEDFLGQYTAQHFRLLCLQSKYRSRTEWTDSSMTQALATEKRLKGFFTTVETLENAQEVQWTIAEEALQKALFGTRNEIDCALRDDFDTPTALQRILDLVQKTNAYLARKSNNHSQNESSDQESDHERSGALSVGPSAVHVHLVRSVAHFVDRMLCLFGLEMTRPKENGLAALVTSSSEMDHVLHLFQSFRATVRSDALKNREGQKEDLEDCDRLRSDVLRMVGMRIRDSVGHEKSGGTRTGEHRAVVARKTQQEREQDVRNSFVKTGRYATFDEWGIPTHDAKGNVLSSVRRRKCVSRYRRRAARAHMALPPSL